MLILLDPAAEAAEPGPLTWKLATARGRVFEESGRNASRLVDSKKPLRIDGAELIQGVTVRVSAGKPHKIRVAPAP